MNQDIKYEGFYSKYAYKTASRRNKTVLYEGPIQDRPEEFIELVESNHKFCIIYTTKGS